jgi:hypothetical protein
LTQWYSEQGEEEHEEDPDEVVAEKTDPPSESEDPDDVEY